ncbi:hypothetical protein CRG98_020858 [Punica granatum]|uniref:Uncharacterized protein n=1 Tax=Punica granatum TaxID=22663 RepID=A0A2I0JRA0_PUNGR|nr:hypothetical protein CRG98_020858 [Punica granatum]
MARRGSRGGYGNPFLYCFCYLLKRSPLSEPVDQNGVLTAVHRAECPPNAHDFLPRRCDYFEPEAGSRAKAINKHASKQTESNPNPLNSPVESPSYAHPNFNLVGARMCEAYATRLGSVHLLRDARRTHVRMSRHLLFTTRRSRAIESPESRGTGYT